MDEHPRRPADNWQANGPATMTHRLLPAGDYGFDATQTGDRIETGAQTVTAQMIDRFADLTGDRFEIHMSESVARRHGFAGRVAHGLLVLSLIDGLKNQTPAQFRAVASLGWDWHFRLPVLAGDTIRASLTVAERRAVQKPDRGILALDVEVWNQNGGLVQSGRNLLMVYR